VARTVLARSWRDSSARRAPRTAPEPLHKSFTMRELGYGRSRFVAPTGWTVTVPSRYTRGSHRPPTCEERNGVACACCARPGYLQGVRQETRGGGAAAAGRRVRDGPARLGQVRPDPDAQRPARAERRHHRDQRRGPHRPRRIRSASAAPGAHEHGVPAFRPAPPPHRPGQPRLRPRTARGGRRGTSPHRRAGPRGCGPRRVGGPPARRPVRRPAAGRRPRPGRRHRPAADGRGVQRRPGSTRTPTSCPR